MIPSPYYQQQAPPHSAQQLAAYVNDPGNHVQAYSHGETGAQPPVSNAKPDVIYAPSSTPAPLRTQSPSAEFSIVKSIESPIYYSHDVPPSTPVGNKLQHHQAPPSSLPPGPHYIHSPAKPAIQTHYSHHQLYPSLTHPNTGILNYFGLQQKPPTSLIDSYVPSSLQLSPVKTTAIYGGPKSPASYAPLLPAVHHHRHPPVYQTSYPVSHSSYPVFPTYSQPSTVLHAAPSVTYAGGHNQSPVSSPAYNTIAYSVPLAYTKTSAHYKRSPEGLLSITGAIRPQSVSAAPSASITKLHPAKQQP